MTIKIFKAGFRKWYADKVEEVFVVQECPESPLDYEVSQGIFSGLYIAKSDCERLN